MSKTLRSILTVAMTFSLLFTSAYADAVSKWAKGEFSLSTLSETIPTHTYESKTLTKAFEEITGVKVNHQLLGEGEVVQAVQTQMQTGRNLYDAYINDSDLIGTHSRLQLAVNLTDWMAGEGKDVTLPTLDINDFIGKSFTTGPDGKLSVSYTHLTLPTKRIV